MNMNQVDLNEHRLKEQQKSQSTKTGILALREKTPEGHPWSAEKPLVRHLPKRYTIRESEEGRFLRCQDTPTISVFLNRTYAYTETDARKLGKRVILLDGAGRFGPLIDDDKQFYNLDHHEGCLRAFTLATCEQALILVLKGLALDKGDWRIFANEPDLDTVFSIWVLLNYKRLRTMSPVKRDVIVPMLRLEGSIDANGFEIAEFCGLPQDVLKKIREKLDRLHQHELDVKRGGEWTRMDIAAYTLEMLNKIDKLVYNWNDLSDFVSVEEDYGHVEIGDHRVAVICRDNSGIYEIEKRLKKLWGDSLGIIVLQKEEGQYTLRRTAALAGIDLSKAYDKLNLLDPNVDGRPAEKRWGGSDDIGGSPRPDGTGLNPLEIRKIFRLAYRPQNIWNRLKPISLATLTSAVLTFMTALSVLLWNYFFGQPEPDSVDVFTHQGLLFSLVLAAGAAGLTSFFAHQWLWLFGFRRPAGLDWLALTPVVLIGGAAGGAWVPLNIAVDPSSLANLIIIVVFLAVALELAFRGLIHGMMVLDFKIQRVKGQWFISEPTWLSAALFALATLVAWYLGYAGFPFAMEPIKEGLVIFSSAFMAGIALGMIRERSLSLWPGIVMQVIAGLLRLTVGYVFPL